MNEEFKFTEVNGTGSDEEIVTARENRTDDINRESILKLCDCYQMFFENGNALTIPITLEECLIRYKIYYQIGRDNRRRLDEINLVPCSLCTMNARTLCNLPITEKNYICVHI